MIKSFYETDRALAEYLLFHYGSAKQVMPYSFGPADALHFPMRCVRECLNDLPLPPNASGLDLGCAVGRSSFELARHCARVMGIDYSQRFIDAARQLQAQGQLPFAYTEEGELTTEAIAIVPADIERSCVSFEQGDAMSLRSDLGAFEVVLMANLIDRLPEPRRCLTRLPLLVKAGGRLVITSPYTWLEEYTPRNNWLGGFRRDGKLVRTLDTLRSELEPYFTLQSTKDLPFLIREHARKFQWSVAQASIWQRT